MLKYTTENITRGGCPAVLITVTDDDGKEYYLPIVGSKPDQTTVERYWQLARQLWWNKRPKSN